jgi:hypothetical protein
MERYKNRERGSKVYGYELSDDSITVIFNDGAMYVYTNISTGRDNVSRMKVLAQAGQGLNRFINAKVKRSYARKSTWPLAEGVTPGRSGTSEG